ncbi:kinase-like domain-containing protein [Daldinia grandis]|nr:kinase-like domain-containing protein [Daldinia grandis]
MDKDDLAWEKSDQEVEAWERSLNKSHIYRGIIDLIKTYRPGEAVELHRPIRGGYNVFYRLEYKDGSSVAMRIPCEGIVKFPEEKVRYEVATMRYVAANTTIPVPRIYHFGAAAENPVGLGPFIIMDYIEHERTMSDALKDPALEPDESHVLDPTIDEGRLEFLYGQMANIVLQLSTLKFPRIGSLGEDQNGDISVSGRPLIQNMNSLLEFAGVAPTLLPSRPYDTSDEWFCALADMHLAQLTFQHNDAVLDEDDARDKYLARQLFRRLASEGQLTSRLDAGVDDGGKDIDGSGFGLYSEDLRPSNVLIDKDDRVVGVIDWEFAYAAPPQFSFDPPWWLLLKGLEYWDDGYESWMEAYEPRLETFLRVLEREEREERKKKSSSEIVGNTIASSSLEDVPLSRKIRNSWEKRAWMVNYAARSSWVFDFIFWEFLDPEYFGDNEKGDHHPRLSLLTEQQIGAMEPFVKMKMEESKERSLVEWNHDDAVVQLAKVLV